MNTISILGCGWLGTPLARRLLSEGYLVKGSTTSDQKIPSLRDVGIQPYLIRLDPAINGLHSDDFFKTDILLIDIPPLAGRHGDAYHPQQIRAILEAIRKQAALKVLYISSTSVYPQEGNNLTEEDSDPAASGANQALLQAEALLREALGERLTILRCGGLMGYDRIPGKWSKGGEVADTPINYLHRDDALEIIVQLLAQNKWGQVYNACSPEHPSRAAIYQKIAREQGWPQPTVIPADTHKTISPEKLQQELGYQFLYPDPLDFPYNQ
jgi:nucleoside-diphosphate-sugar epimerase